MPDSDLITEGRQKLATASPDQVRRVLADGAGPAQRALHVGFGTSELILWALANLDRLLDIVEEARKLRRLDEVTVEGVRRDKVELNAYRDAMRDVRRILTDLGVTNPPPRLRALLEGVNE